jgi:DNA-binding CsgD family transcriptional regulator
MLFQYFTSFQRTAASRYISFMLFLVLICLSGKAQKNYNYPFIKNFKRSEYKAGMQTWMISQAHNGLLYFANDNGLLEFDGLNWELYGIYNYSIIRAALTVDDGKIYVGLSNDFGYFDSDSTGLLRFYSLLHLLPPKERRVEEIWRIHQTSEGLIFQSFNKLIVINENKAWIYPAPTKFHYSFHINNKIYVVDEIKGILEFRHGNFLTLKGTEALTDYEITSILPYGKDLMITTTDHGVFIYRNKSIVPWNTAASDFLKENQIYCAIRINENKIAFGTIQKGLLITDNQGNPLIAMDKSKGLQNNTILSMKLDKSGNLWLGTDNGIALLYINSPINQLSFNEGIGSGYTATIHNNIMYLGTNQGVFYKKLNGNENILQNLGNFQLVPETKGQVWTLKVIDGQLFCGHNKGAFIIEQNKARLISDVKGAWVFMQSEENPHRIIGGTYTGLTLYEKENEGFKYKGKIKGFDESSRLMHFDDYDNLWMSHGFKGVYRIVLNENADSAVRVDFYNSQKGFATDFGINLVRLQEQLVFLSSEGAYEYNSANDTMIPSAYFNEFFNYLKVNNAQEDAFGNIWYYEDFNVAVKLIKADGTYKNISMPFKQLQGDFIEGFQSVYPINQKNYLICSKNGFIHYDPSQVLEQETPFNRYLSKIELSKTDSLLFKGHLFNNNKNIPVLDYKNNSIHFYYSAINYEKPDKVEFSTMLVGHDSEWSKWEKRYNREYTNLNEGKYVFQVRARNMYNEETEVLSYSFSILPPWRRTKLAYLTYSLSAIVVLILIVALIRRRINYLRTREKHVQKEKYMIREQKLHEEALIAEKEIIRLRNEKLREEIKNKDKELANSTMLTIQKNKFLISLKQEMAKVNSEMINDIAKRHNKQLIRKIDNEINNEKNWKVFEKHFMDVHKEFLIKIKNEYPQISPAELRLCACLRMNISSKEIASLLNISLRGVEASRYRLRKTLDLDRKQNLTDFILTI